MAGVSEGECLESSSGGEYLTLKRRYSCGLSHLFEGWMFFLGPSLLLKDIKGTFSFFYIFHFLLLSFLSWHEAC